MDKFTDSSSAGDVGSPVYYIKINGYDDRIKTCNGCENIGDKVYAVINAKNNKVITTFKMSDYINILVIN